MSARHAARERPLLIWDGDCGFCRRWIARLRRVTGERIEYGTSQELAASFPEVPAGTFDRAVVLIRCDGSHAIGAAAAVEALATRPGLGWLPRLVARLPGLSRVLEATYAAIAGRRSRLSCSDSDSRLR